MHSEAFNFSSFLDLTSWRAADLVVMLGTQLCKLIC